MIFCWWDDSPDYDTDKIAAVIVSVLRSGRQHMFLLTRHLCRLFDRFLLSRAIVDVTPSFPPICERTGKITKQGACVAGLKYETTNLK
jgi:hypothetical protein